MWKEVFIAGGGTVVVVGGTACVGQLKVTPTPTFESILEISIPRSGEKIDISSREFVRASWAYLKQPSFNDGSTFFDLLGPDTHISDPVIFDEPRTGQASKIGNKVRLYPILGSGLPPARERINAMEHISWSAEIMVTNPDKSIELFGLLTEPHDIYEDQHIYEVQPDQPAGTLNIIEFRGRKYRIIPAFVALRRTAPDGCITWFVHDSSNSDSDRPYSYLLDGSVCYDKGVIGPSTADIQRANNK